MSYTLKMLRFRSPAPLFQRHLRLWLTALAVLLFTTPQRSLGKESWLRLRSPNFEMYTAIGTRQSTDILRAFEQVREFFLKSTRARLTTHRPTRIVVFGDEAQFKIYSTRDRVVGYAFRTEHRDHIGMLHSGRYNREIATHEYMHLLISESQTKLPTWFQEGTAELFATIVVSENKVKVGELGPSAIWASQNQRWFDLDKLLRARYDDPLFNNPELAQAFYAQSWAMVHMINLSPDYRPQVSKFVAALAAEGAERAFAQVYGKTLLQVRDDFDKYLDRKKLKVAVYDLPLEKVAAVETQPAEDVEMQIVLGTLLAQIKSSGTALDMYNKAASTQPASWELREELGYLAERLGKAAEANEHFAKAIELGCINRSTILHYAGLLGDTPVAAEAFKRALERIPDFDEARFRLGLLLIKQEHLQEGIAQLEKMKQLRPEWSLPYCRALVHANLRLGKQDRALAAAQAARSYAQTPEEIAEAEQLKQVAERSVTQPR
jgi:tetratricopeptide (TPR) repeat protein